MNTQYYKQGDGCTHTDPHLPDSLTDDEIPVPEGDKHESGEKRRNSNLEFLRNDTRSMMRKYFLSSLQDLYFDWIALIPRIGIRGYFPVSLRDEFISHFAITIPFLNNGKCERHNGKWKMGNSMRNKKCAMRNAK